MTKEEKERKVTDLYMKGANIREISKRVHLSFSDIGKIIRKFSGDPEPNVNLKKLSKHSQALELLRTNHSNLDVAITVGLTYLETEEEQKQYRDLINMDKFCDLYDAMKGDLEGYLQLNAELNNANIGIKDAIEGLRYARSIDSMKLEYANLQGNLKQIRNDSFLVDGPAKIETAK